MSHIFLSSKDFQVTASWMRDINYRDHVLRQDSDRTWTVYKDDAALHSSESLDSVKSFVDKLHAKK